MNEPAPVCRLKPWDPRRAQIRLVVATMVGMLTAFLAPWPLPAHARGLLGWDAGSLVFLLLAWSLILRADAHDTRANAAVEDPGRTMVWVLALGSSFFSFVAAFLEIRGLKMATHWQGLGPFAAAGVFLAWFVTHTSYSLRYAHLYYSGGEVGGLQFPGKDPPTELDFAYFAFTLGMCFQVSDIVISDSRIRRMALGHSLLSFMYNTLIFAMTLNFTLDFLR